METEMLEFMAAASILPFFVGTVNRFMAKTKGESTEEGETILLIGVICILPWIFSKIF